MMRVARRALKRFTVIATPINEDQTCFSVILRRDASKANTDLPIPGCWITPTEQRITIFQVYGMIQMYFETLMVQPWERHTDGI